MCIKCVNIYVYVIQVNTCIYIYNVCKSLYNTPIYIFLSRLYQLLYMQAHMHILKTGRKFTKLIIVIISGQWNCCFLILLLKLFCTFQLFHNEQLFLSRIRTKGYFFKTWNESGFVQSKTPVSSLSSCYVLRGPDSGHRKVLHIQQDGQGGQGGSPRLRSILV